MQTVNRYNSSSASHHTRRIAILAIVLFGLSGLISGFAVGAFVRPKLPGGLGINSNNGNATPPPIARNSGTKAPAPQENVTVGVPLIKNFTYTEVADGTTPYSFSVQTVYDDGKSTPIRESDVTCKLWLTRQNNPTSAFLKEHNYAVLVNINGIGQPFAHETRNALNFIAPTQQVQNCTANGETTWKYTVSTSLDPGTYYVFVLADWQGKHFNWVSEQIQITQGG
jgi:hypothetical protein